MVWLFLNKSRQDLFIWFLLMTATGQKVTLASVLAQQYLGIPRNLHSLQLLDLFFLFVSKYL